ncbi:uncharacterized protein G2W53_017431 [Senna tora]|uniref:Uncharacterized protein n=1 Tax=Senna tora TaxID=362788 RepID=A0A834WKH6_9FABA|nr:uncharacterized protein G2W53_017431 [Senna tora]
MEHIEGRNILQERPFQPDSRFPFYQQIEDSRLVALVQLRSKGNLAFVRDLYYQGKMYGKVDHLTFRGKLILEIDPKDIKEHYGLPNHPNCAYPAGEKDKSLVANEVFYYDYWVQNLALMGQRPET